MRTSVAASLLLSALTNARELNVTSFRSVSAQPIAPAGSVKVPADFFSFGFETAFLHHFNNNFSDNIVASVGARMGKPLIIRIGGTSGDLVSIDPHLSNATKCVKGPGCPIDSRATFELGPSYFETFKLFPNATMTIQAPISPYQEKNKDGSKREAKMDAPHGADMTNDKHKKPEYAPEDWMDQSLEYVKLAYEALGPKRVAGIALGNEPDYYNYGPEEYTRRALALQKRIIDELHLEGDDRRIFEIGDIPNSVIVKRNRDQHFTLTDVVEGGLAKNGYAKFAAQHFYQVGAGNDYSGELMQQTLMNHTAITERFPPLNKSIADIKKTDPKIDFVLSETAGVMGGRPIKYAGGFGSAMWAVDFHLTAMAAGVKRVSNTMRPEAAHAFWVSDSSAPKTRRPMVQGVFPSAPFIADFVGKDDQGKVIELPTGHELFTAYAKYDVHTGKLARIALINLKRWDPTSPEKRGAASVTLDVGDRNAENVRMERMESGQGSAGLGLDYGGPTHNVTWAGEQWSHKVDKGKGHYVLGGRVQEIVHVNHGKAEVLIPDTEAAIIYFYDGDVTIQL
ncbi:hypothetical protein NUU61_006574 [Penicillium alfredii]|uniref:Beta-glucuronidase C-terminal domain-containing protein n=1 Tax=Penicillium alfredii TaxID=1506179 RepID=A0A9W9F193_9EURO|nr:uncharacterized protein NUU61_006574 [Penicillium alfredii]KAJ5091704.1 hypothetical protein NUU61_006574 [Penicillium alfredii]